MAYYTDKQLQNIKKGLEYAKSNPDDPKSQEITKRLKSGQMNFELKALGLKPVPIETPKVDMSKALSGQVPGQQTMMPTPSRAGAQVTGAAKDVGSDFLEMGQNIRESFKQRTETLGEDIERRQEDGKQTFRESAGTALGYAAATLGTAIDAVEQGGMFVGKALLTDEQEKTIEDSISSGLGSVIARTEGSAGAETVKKLVAGYNKWAEDNPEEAANVRDVGSIVLSLAEVLGAKAGTKVAEETIDTATDVVKKTAPMVKEGVETTAKVGQETFEAGARKTGEAIDAFSEARRPARVAAQQEKVDTAVGRIVQGTPDDVKKAKRALSEVDTQGVKTYAELNTAIDDKIEALSKSVDSELDKYTDLYTPQTTGTYTKVGEKTVVQNSIIDALDGLENAYTKSGELPKAEAIRQLRNQFETSGLTVKQLNQLARKYGVEFKDRAFNKMGDPKSGYNAENFENVRSGVKQAVRDRLPDDVAKELDKKISDLYATKVLTDKMETKVAQLQQRITNRTLAQKVGGAAANLADLMTFGTLRGFVSKIMPSNIGNKAMNSLEIEAELRKNLKQIEKLLNMKDDAKFAEAFVKWAEEMQPGMSIRSTVTPASVGSKLTESEFDLITQNIDDVALGRISDPDFIELLKKYGLSKADNAELERFLKEATDEFERPGATVVNTR